MSLRILLADDHRILREGIRRSFESAGEEVVGEAANGEEACELARTTHPDVIVMDLSMPVVDGIAATRRIRAEQPDAKVVVLTMHDDVDSTRRALSAGAVGFMSKGSSFADVLATVRAAAQGDTELTSELAAAMLHVGGGHGGGGHVGGGHVDGGQVDGPHSGGTLLSERQVEILQAIADGSTTKQVARQLGITQKTVHNHLNAIYRRLDTQSLTHAVLSAVRLGIIELD